MRRKYFLRKRIKWRFWFASNFQFLPSLYFFLFLSLSLFSYLFPDHNPSQVSLKTSSEKREKIIIRKEECFFFSIVKVREKNGFQLIIILMSTTRLRISSLSLVSCVLTWLIFLDSGSLAHFLSLSLSSFPGNERRSEEKDRKQRKS